jgi:hypothetical protein
MLLLAGLIGCGEPKTSADLVAHCGTGLCSDGPVYGVSTFAFVEGDGMGHSRGFHLESRRC